jgi:hypothetical protein
MVSVILFGGWRELRSYILSQGFVRPIQPERHESRYRVRRMGQGRQGV